MTAEHPLITLRTWRTSSTGYQPAEAWDEMFSAPGQPRPAYDALISALQPMDPAELRYRADQLARVFTDRGVTYDLGGEESLQRACVLANEAITDRYFSYAAPVAWAQER
jgi:uncharacterized circularly permuted ATP-grasp superfamily protein